MRSAKARAAAKAHKKRPQSALHPNDRRTRNDDPRGLAFMEFVKGYPCVICWGFPEPPGTCQVFWEYEKANGCPSQAHCGRTEAAHIGGSASAKASNFRVIPLGARHHRTDPNCQEILKDRFGPHWGLDVEALIAALNAEFDRLHSE